MHTERPIVWILVPALAAVLGALIYALAGNPKAAELGRLTFRAGILVTLFVLATQTVSC